MDPQHFSKKVTILSHDPTVQLLVYNPNKLKSRSVEDICTPKFIAALFIIAKIWNQFQCSLMHKSIYEWIYKMRNTATHADT